MEIYRYQSIPGNYLVAQSVASPALTVSAAIAAIKKNPNAKVSIADTSANIAKNLDALRLLGDKVTSIAQTGTPAVLAIKASSAVTNSSVLSKISNSYTLSLTGTISEIGQASSDNNIASIQVIDSSANALSNLSTLKQYKEKLKTIAFTDFTNSINLTPEQINTYAVEIAKITSVNKINAINVSVMQMGGMLANKKVATISVVDNSTNITNGLDALQTVASKITSASIIGGSDELSITTKQLTSDVTVIGKIISGYHLALKGALVSDALKYKNDRHLNSVAVVDTSANIAKNLDALNTLGDKLSEVMQSGKPTTLILTATQINSDSSVLNKISGPYSISASGNVSDVKKIIANTKITALTVTDSMSNIKNNLDVLAANKGKVTAIEFSDKAPVLTLSASSIDANTDILNKIKSSFSIKVTDVAYINLSKYTANSKIASIELKDGISYLQYSSLSKNIKISSFKVNDVTYAQALLLNGNSKVTEIAIKDSSIIFNKNISTIVKNKKIKSINLTDIGITGLAVKEFNTYTFGKKSANAIMAFGSSTQGASSNTGVGISSSVNNQISPTVGYFDTGITPSSQFPVIASGNLDTSVFIYQNGRSWGATSIDKIGNAKKIVNDTGYPGTDFLSQSYVDKNNLYVGFNNGAGIIKYDLDGNLKWSASSSGWTTGIALDNDGSVYVNNDEGFINKFNNNGELVWSISGSKGQAWQGNNLSFSNNTLFSTSFDGQAVSVNSFDPTNGDLKWTKMVENDGGGVLGLSSFSNGNTAVLQNKFDKNLTFLDNNGIQINELGFNTWSGKSWESGPVSWRDLTRFSVYPGPNDTVIAAGLGYKFDEWLPAAQRGDSGGIPIYMYMSQFTKNGEVVGNAEIPLSPNNAGIMYSKSTVDSDGNINFFGITSGDNYFGPSPSPDQEYFFRVKVSSGSLTPPVIKINASDYFSGVDLLNTIPSSTKIFVNDVNIGQLSDILTNNMVSNISISDTANNIVNNLDALQSANVVGTIAVSDSMDLNITSDQQTKYADVLAKLTGTPKIHIAE